MRAPRRLCPADWRKILGAAFWRRAFKKTFDKVITATNYKLAVEKAVKDGWIDGHAENWSLLRESRADAKKLAGRKEVKVELPTKASPKTIKKKTASRSKKASPTDSATDAAEAEEEAMEEEEAAAPVEEEAAEGDKAEGEAGDEAEAEE